MRRAGWIGLIALLAMPASAAPWGTAYQMGQFAAGGGSPETGMLNLSCGDPDAGIDDAGELFVQFTLPEGQVYKAKAPLDKLNFSVDGVSLDLPMMLEQGGANVFVSGREAEGSTLTRDLVTALRGGKTVSIGGNGTELATIPLDGANAALDAIDTCIRSRD